MAHDRKIFVFSLCSFVYCVEGACDAAFRGNPDLKNGAPRDDLKNGRGPVWAVPCDYPSDTKLFLTKNYSEIIVFEKLRISHAIP